MENQSPWQWIGPTVGLLTAVGAVLVYLGLEAAADPTLLLWLSALSFLLAGGFLAWGFITVARRKRRRRREQQFPPGLEPVMTTPPEHRKAEEGRRFQQDDSAVMNPLIRAEYARAKREQAEAIRNERSLQQLRRDAEEIARYIAQISDEAAAARTDTGAKGFGLSPRYLRATEVAEERAIINHFHKEVGSHVIATYEGLRGRGYGDEPLDRIYKDPGSASDIREIGHRLSALIRDMPEWTFAHLQWPAEFGGPGVWLDATGPESDPRVNIWCEVRAPDGSVRERDQSDAFTGARSDAAPVDVRWLYPQHFPDPPKPPIHLADGKYSVRWYGQRGVGRELLGVDTFLIDAGEVRNLDGTPVRVEPALS